MYCQRQIQNSCSLDFCNGLITTILKSPITVTLKFRFTWHECVDVAASVPDLISNPRHATCSLPFAEERLVQIVY